MQTFEYLTGTFRGEFLWFLLITQTLGCLMSKHRLLFYLRNCYYFYVRCCSNLKVTRCEIEQVSTDN